jgi:NADH-quinone oxidoreductase subunit J
MITPQIAVFLVLSAVTVAGAVSLILQRHPIHSALSLIVVMVALAGLYLLQGAEFVAAVQIIVYAGAIMVLFVFVIMLLNAGAEPESKLGLYVKLFGIPLLIVLLGLVTFVIQAVLPKSDIVSFGTFTGGGAKEVGRSLFTQYLLPFEVTSVLILIAIVGAIVLARKEID